MLLMWWRLMLLARLFGIGMMAVLAVRSVLGVYLVADTILQKVETDTTIFGGGPGLRVLAEGVFAEVGMNVLAAEWDSGEILASAVLDCVPGFSGAAETWEVSLVVGISIGQVNAAQ